jgi:hypothetical protein
MKKAVIFGLLALALAAGVVPAQRLRAGEQAIFLKSGDEIVGSIKDISSTRLVLGLADGTEIPLRDLWMINFVNDEWNFPQERNLIETNEHYVFLKSGDVASGRIVDMSSEQRVFEFETGEKFGIGQVRRIYFSRNVPRGLR